MFGGHAPPLRHVHLRIRGHARTRSSISQRTAARDAGRSHSLSKVVLRQTTTQPKARHRIELVLAKTLLRPQREGCARVQDKVTIRASQPSRARTGEGASRVEVEQLSTLRTEGNWGGRNRVRLDSNGSGSRNGRRPHASVTEPRLASKERTRTWGTGHPNPISLAKGRGTLFLGRAEYWNPLRRRPDTMHAGSVDSARDDGMLATLGYFLLSSRHQASRYFSKRPREFVEPG